jgi:hypothetical protein
VNRRKLVNVVWNLVLLGCLVTVIVTGSRMALAGSADETTCTLVVPADPLTAKGLATPYELLGPCHESNPDTAAFVQGTVLDPATGAVSVYDPLVVDRGKLPAVAPTVPKLPAGAVVGLWFGFNGDNLLLKGTKNSLSTAECVTGLGESHFGQFAFCHANAFFAAAATAVSAGKLRIPPIGTAADGRPCPTVRDFSLVDADQSDNVTSTYLFLRDGSTAQNTAANEAALATMGAQILVNGSDNALLDDFVDPALGCTPYTAPDLAQPGRVTTSLALNELQANQFQAAPSALVPLNDPMTVDDGKANAKKTNLYRAGVGQPALGTADTAKSYCVDLVNVGPGRVKLDRSLTKKAKSPDSGAANSLFTFLAQRLNGSFDTLDCGKLLHRKNPVALITNKQGVVVDARLEAAQVPVPVPTPSTSSSSGSSGSATASPSASSSASATPSTTATHGPAMASQPAPSVTPTKAAANPAPANHAPANPRPADPRPANPAPANPRPANPAPANPAPANPAPANPAPPNAYSGDGTAPTATPTTGPTTGPTAANHLAPAKVPAKAHSTTVNKASSLTNYAPGAALVLSGALLTIGTGFKVVHSRRKRRQDWDYYGDGPDLEPLGIVVSRDEAIEYTRRHGHRYR